MNTQQSTTLATFITMRRDEVHVRLADAVEERLDGHRRRHRDDAEQAPARVREGDVLHLGHAHHRAARATAEHTMPTAEKTAPPTRQKKAALASTAPAACRSPSA